MEVGGRVAKKLGDGLMALFGYLFATIVAVGKIQKRCEIATNAHFESMGVHGRPHISSVQSVIDP